MKNSKLIQDLTREEFNELYNNNKWLRDKISELAYEDLNWQQSEEFNMIGCKVFNYHNHYSSFFLTPPIAYGVMDGLKIAGELNDEYLNDENMELYEKLNKIAAQYNELDYDQQQDEEGEKLEDEANEIAKKLADGITRQLREYESGEAIEQAIEAQKDLALDGFNYISELEAIYTDDGELGKRPSWRHVQEVNIH